MAHVCQTKRARNLTNIQQIIRPVKIITDKSPTPVNSDDNNINMDNSKVSQGVADQHFHIDLGVVCKSSSIPCSNKTCLQ